jgi:endonuclease YncB( thermonuclease family)
MTMRALLPLAMLVLCGSEAAAQVDCNPQMETLPESWEGSAYAVSGDTIAGVGLKPPLALWGIRAPEMGNEPSVPAMRARAALADMLVAAGHRVSCRMTAFDDDCRAVAQCTIMVGWPTGSKAQPHDLALRLVEDGFAYGSGLGSPPEWDKDASEKIAHSEALSRQARKGLWPDWLGERAR